MSIHQRRLCLFPDEDIFGADHRTAVFQSHLPRLQAPEQTVANSDSPNHCKTWYLCSAAFHCSQTLQIPPATAALLVGLSRYSVPLYNLRSNRKPLAGLDQEN